MMKNIVSAILNVYVEPQVNYLLQLKKSNTSANSSMEAVIDQNWIITYLRILKGFLMLAVCGCIVWIWFI